jgi:phosphoribosylamine--glycine ligase
MGAVSPNPRLSRWAIEETVDVILQPVAREMVRRGTPYRGVIYAGVILDAMGPRLLEFNVRFGDPEAQVILPRIQGNLARHLKAAAEGRLHEAEALSLSERVATCVVMASRGYPDAYTRGTEIRGVDDAAGLEDVIVFHAGTRRENGRLLSNGGRVLGITGLGDSTEASVDKAYEAVAKIDWPEGFCRSDIGRRKGTDIS